MAQLQRDSTALLALTQVRAETLAADAMGPLAALLSRASAYASRSAAREQTGLAAARKELAAIAASVAAPTIPELSALAAASPGWPARVDPPLAVGRERWTAARAALESALADAAAALAPREVVCEGDVPLSALVPSAAPVELGVAELCGVTFECRVRRGCGCGKSPMISVAAEDQPHTAVEGVSDASIVAAVPCDCALVCEVEASMDDNLAASYDKIGARDTVVQELIEFYTDDDLNSESEAGMNNANSSVNTFTRIVTSVHSSSPSQADEAAVSSSSLPQIDAAVQYKRENECFTFGRVNVTFELSSPSTGQHDNTVQTHSGAETRGVTETVTLPATASTVSSSLWLCDSSKRTTVFVIGRFVELSDSAAAKNDPCETKSSCGRAVHARCTFSFPDVFQQSRAFQMFDAESLAFVNYFWQNLWQRVFESHLVQSLKAQRFSRTTLPLADLIARSEDAMTEYALKTFQRRARNHIIAHARTLCLVYRDVTMSINLQSHAGTFHFHLRIRLDDVKFPCHAAHFRNAASNRALGTSLHTCIRTSETSRSTTPFAVICNHCEDGAFLGRILKDTVFGEHKAPARDTVYPPGTVLVSPFTVFPRANTLSSLFFIVFYPMNASTIPGAVPVGTARYAHDASPQDYRSFDSILATQFDAVRSCAERYASCTGCYPSSINFVRLESEKL